MYQALKNQEISHEAETLAGLKAKILNYDHDTLPDFTVHLVDEDGEVMTFNDTAFLQELRSDWDESVMDTFYRHRMEA